MTKEQLNELSKSYFKQHTTVNRFYAIDDGNFWTEDNFNDAKHYASKFGKELFHFDKEEVLKPEVKKEDLDISSKKEVSPKKKRTYKKRTKK